MLRAVSRAWGDSSSACYKVQRPFAVGPLDSRELD